MAATSASRRSVFRTVAQQSYTEWPAYESSPLYDRASLDALAADVRAIATPWFRHDDHESITEFVWSLPLAYVMFDTHDRYGGSTRYEMETLFRVFVLKECHGWDHETALIEHLERRPELCEQLDLEPLPDQSTLWRSWHDRFTAALSETVETTARTILITAQNAGITVPREPERLAFPDESDEETPPTDRAVIEQADAVTDHVSHVVFPAFLLDRGTGCEINENAFWDLKTYLGLRENLAANEGARGFVYESQRERTPLGHVHRKHIRRLSIAQIRAMYRAAIERLLDRLDETEAFHGAGIVAIDITEADPFTG